MHFLTLPWFRGSGRTRSSADDQMWGDSFLEGRADEALGIAVWLRERARGVQMLFPARICGDRYAEFFPQRSFLKAR